MKPRRWVPQRSDAERATALFSAGFWGLYKQLGEVDPGAVIVALTRVILAFRAGLLATTQRDVLDKALRESVETLRQVLDDQ